MSGKEFYSVIVDVITPDRKHFYRVYCGGHYVKDKFVANDRNSLTPTYSTIYSLQEAISLLKDLGNSFQNKTIRIVPMGSLIHA